jgi:cytochrome c oxidase subunit I+III
MRTQLALPSQSILAPAQYDQTVTMHGLLMVLWFLSPLGIAFANYFIPLQIGAKDLAFPRLNAFSYWLYLAGGVTAFLGFFVPGGSAAAGWTNYSPLTSLQFSPGAGETLGAAGILTLVASTTMGTVNILVTILWYRAPGVTWLKMPMFTWFTFFTMLQFLWAFPSLFAGIVMLESDRILGTFFFTSAAGGSILWDHVWWFFGHPEVYIVLLPAFGVVAEILATFSGRVIYARKPLLAAVGVIVLLSYMVYGHHMFLTGINLTEREVFTINTEAISIPFGVVMLSFVGTMYKSAVRLKTPMLFALGSIFVFIIGGLSGVFNSSLALDIALRGTYFVVGHFHYVMVGASEFGLFAAIYYWWPKMTGRMYNETLGKVHFILSFIGFNLTFFPMFLLQDMPRRIFTYTIDTGWGPMNFLATMGSYIFIPSQLLLIANLLMSARKGPPAPENPWNSTSREWTSQPSSSIVHGMGNGAVHEAHHLSSRPVTISLGLGLFMIGLGLGIPTPAPGSPPGSLSIGPFFAIAVLGIIVAGWGLTGWARDDYRGKFTMPEEEEGNRWPFAQVPKVKLAMWVFLGSEAVLFGVLLGSYSYIRFNLPTWPLTGSVHNITIGTANTIILLTSSLTAYFAVQSAKAGNRSGLLRWLGATLGLGSIFIIIKGAEWFDLLSTGTLTPSSGLPGSTFFVTTGIHTAHILAGLLVLTYLIRKTAVGGFTQHNYETVENFGLYWSFVDCVWIFIFAMFYLM